MSFTPSHIEQKLLQSNYPLLKDRNFFKGQVGEPLTFGETCAVEPPPKLILARLTPLRGG